MAGPDARRDPATQQDIRMDDHTHDLVVRHVARTRFPFPGQTDWPPGYTTLTNVGERRRGIVDGDGVHYPDIVILNERGEPCRIGEVETVVDAASVRRWRLGAEAADTINETGVRNLFVYVPAGQEAAAQALLDANGISFAGLRGYAVEGEHVAIDPFLTRGDTYDHQATDSAMQRGAALSEGDKDAAGLDRADHDRVVRWIARNRFPFPGQTDWPADYRTIVNVDGPERAIDVAGAPHHPDIVIVNADGEIREIGEVELTLDPDAVPAWSAGSALADDLTETGVRHFFLYVPAGMEEDAVVLLDRHGISFAGVRGFAVGQDGAVRIVPFVTRGDRKDHK